MKVVLMFTCAFHTFKSLSFNIVFVVSVVLILFSDVVRKVRKHLLIHVNIKLNALNDCGLGNY